MDFTDPYRTVAGRNNLEEVSMLCHCAGLDKC